jgi:hypothetical protein
MKLEVNVGKKTVVVLFVMMVFAGGLIYVNAYNSGGPPSVFGHSLEEIEGIPVCSNGEVLTNDGSGGLSCVAVEASGGGSDHVQIYCFAYYGSQAQWGHQWLAEVNMHPVVAVCPGGYALENHGVIYSYGEMNDWNDNQHKTWYVKGDYSNNLIECRVHGTDNSAGVAGVGTCVSNN